MIQPNHHDAERGYPSVYTPAKAIGHVSTLAMDDDDKKRAADREQRKNPIGFAVDPVEPAVGHA